MKFCPIFSSSFQASWLTF